MKDEDIITINKTRYSISFICAVYNLRVKEVYKSTNRMYDKYKLEDEKGRTKTISRRQFFSEALKRNKIEHDEHFLACATRDYDLF